MRKVIKMSIDHLVKEHKELVKILRSGSKPLLRKEANKQAKELKEYKKTGK